MFCRGRCHSRRRQRQLFVFVFMREARYGRLQVVRPIFSTHTGCVQSILISFSNSFFFICFAIVAALPLSLFFSFRLPLLFLLCVCVFFLLLTFLLAPCKRSSISQKITSNRFYFCLVKCNLHQWLLCASWMSLV